MNRIVEHLLFFHLARGGRGGKTLGCGTVGQPVDTVVDTQDRQRVG